MSVIRSHEDYFQTIRTFRQAPVWQQELMLKGSLLTKCKEMEPVSIRLKLQKFWDHEAKRLGMTVGELKTWN